MHRKQQGFTLIELMIVIVIVSIIATIAATSFSGATQDGERARIMAELNSLNDAMARYYQGSYSYTDATEAVLRDGLIQETASYNVEVAVSGDGQGYFIWANPKVPGKMEGEGTLSVNEAGVRCRFAGDDSADPRVDACPGPTW